MADVLRSPKFGDFRSHSQQDFLKEQEKLEKPMKKKKPVSVVENAADSSLEKMQSEER